MRTPRGYRLRTNPSRRGGGGNGIPNWVIPAVIVGGGLVAYLVLSKPSAPKPVVPAQTNAFANILGSAAKAFSSVLGTGAPAAKPAAQASSGIPGIVTSYDQLTGY